MNSIKIDQIQPWSCYFFWLQPYSGAGGGGLILPKFAQYIGFFIVILDDLEGVGTIFPSPLK